MGWKYGMALVALLLSLGMTYAAVGASGSATAISAVGIGCPANAILVKCEIGSADAAQIWTGRDGCKYACATIAQCKPAAEVACKNGQTEYKYADKDGCTIRGCRDTGVCPLAQEPKCEGGQLYKYLDSRGCTKIGCATYPNCPSPVIPTCGTGSELYKTTDPAGCPAVSCRKVSSTGNVGVKLSAPNEVMVGDSFKMAAFVSYIGTASADTAHNFKVVTQFEGGSQDPNLDQMPRVQEHVDYITLASGESATVETSFSANNRGVKLLTVNAYENTGTFCDPRRMSAVPCPEGTYSLATSASAKVKVVGELTQNPAIGTIVLHSGWNMVSVPVNEKVSMARVASECNTASYAWRYNANYQQVETLEPGVGYWIYANSGDCKVPVSAKTYTMEIASLSAGWNLIGALGQRVAMASFSGNCKITAGPWIYGTAASAATSPYSYSGTLEPGRGYWVKVESSCKLGSTTGQPPQVPA